ncbi:MAG: hypothetical protein JJ867_03940 [Marinobacter sp.]|nr:hypothetical protein [Marinobacter sp.]
MFSIGSFSLGALFGILVTAVVNHFLAKSRDRENSQSQARQLAGIRLQEAFADALNAFDPHIADEEDAYTVLHKSFKEHSKAIRLFRPHLSEKEKQEFDKAWMEYYCYEGENIPYLEQYSSHVGSHELYLESCDLGTKRVERILSFAET